jgi:hypothetical protein
LGNCISCGGACRIGRIGGNKLLHSNKGYMKAGDWIIKNKYPIMVVAFFIVVLLLVLVFINGMKKDHTLDLVKMEMKLKEDARLQIQKERNYWQDMVDSKDKAIYQLQVRDSLIDANNIIIDNRLQGLPKKYNENADKINHYNDADLLDYFNKLPVQSDNDY